MKVTSLALYNFRSFVNLPLLELGAINVLIGANNAGKSSILRALSLLQTGLEGGIPDVRAGAQNAQIMIHLSDLGDHADWKRQYGSHLGNGTLNITIQSLDRKTGNISNNLVLDNGSSIGMVPLFPPIEPNHFIIPHFSKRKAVAYNEDVRLQYAIQIYPNMSNLAAKLSRLSNPSFPGYEQYRSSCEAILGFMVSAVPSEGGQRPGAYLPNRESIYIDQMGEGVPNIVSLLADLAISEGKLFLIEEPENDLHPTALKALLDSIITSSQANQFVVSTHSNIVLRHLGAMPDSRVYKIATSPGSWPTVAEAHLIDNTPEARISALQELGYSLSDFDLWDGWLILEESSAERIIRDYLIPWFAPRLSRVRTLAAGGVNKVDPTFEDFHRLVRYTHLEQAYCKVTWVLVDGDAPGKATVSELQNKYKSWSADRFAHFSNEQFEHYYPAPFKDKVAQVLAISDKKVKREQKRLLLDEVRMWLDEDRERGVTALEKSAEEIINTLKGIEAQLTTPQPTA